MWSNAEMKGSVGTGGKDRPIVLIQIINLGLGIFSFFGICWVQIKIIGMCPLFWVFFVPMFFFVGD